MLARRDRRADERRALVATDARRKEIYWAVYDKGVRVTEPAVDRPASVAGAPGGAGVESGFAVGDGALRYRRSCRLAAVARVADEPRYPPPGGARRARGRPGPGAAPSEPLTPLYLRRPDAVEPGARKPVRQ